MELQEDRASGADRFADALRGAQAGVWEWILKTDLLTWSPEMSALTGVEPDVPPSRELFFSLIHPEDRPALYLATVHAVDVSSEMAVELRLMHPSGIRQISIRAQVIRDDQGAAVRLVGLAQDVTEQRGAEARYERLARLAPCIVWITDPCGRTNYVNPRWEEVIGEPYDFAGHGTRIRMMHPEDYRINAARWHRAVAEAVPYEAEVRFRVADGSYRWYLERAEPVFDEDGKVLEWFGTGVDIHDRMVATLESRKLIDSMPNIAWAVNPSGEVDFLNQVYLDYSGLGPEARGEKGWRDVVHPDDRGFSAEYTECVRARQIWSQELRLRRHDGVYRWHLSRLVPIYDDDGRLIRWFGTSTDIHDQKTKEQTLAFLVNLTEATRIEADPDAILKTTLRLLGEHLGATRCAYSEIDDDGDHTHIVRDWGPGLPSIEGTYRRSDFGRRTQADLSSGRCLVLRDVDHEIEPAEARAAYAKLNVAASIVCPLIMEGRTQVSLSVFSSTPRDWSSDEIELVQMVTDRVWSNIERARSEHALRELNLDLERRVAERTRELVEANREMEGFTYTVSHDLRAPLRAITATSMIMLQDSRDKLSTAEAALLERQAHNAKRLGILIDDLLKLSRLSREEMRLAHFNLSNLAQEVVDELVADGRAGHVLFKIAPDLTAMGDPRLVRFVLLNLLENACKFSTRKADAPSLVRVGRRGNAFFVADEGIGFDPRYVERLFRPFERLVTEAEFPGTGIGLANVKRIVERHGGSAWAESETGKGATFWFTLDGSGEPR